MASVRGVCALGSVSLLWNTYNSFIGEREREVDVKRSDGSDGRERYMTYYMYLQIYPKGAVQAAATQHTLTQADTRHSITHHDIHIHLH